MSPRLAPPDHGGTGGPDLPEIKFKVLGVIEVSASGRLGIAAAVVLIFFWTITSMWT